MLPANVAWGKYDERLGTFHRLEHHCADVAACFEALICDPILAVRFGRAAGKGAKLDPITSSRLTAIAFLHDFAKLNAGFQFKVKDRGELPSGAPPRAGHINEAFYAMNHERLLEALGFVELCKAWGEGFIALLLAALAHHGRPAREPSGEGPSALWAPFADYDPVVTAELLRDRMRSWFPEGFRIGPPLPTHPALAHLFAGTVALADQIGSDSEQHFPFEPTSDPRYIDRARQRARKAVRDKGLSRSSWRNDFEQIDFRSMFGHAEPRPLQRAAETAALDAPLLVLESETGSGKTEAALLRFASLWKAGLVDGLYFAVPTRAAAKQLHRRVATAMSNLLPARWGTVLAVPGYHVVGEAVGVSAGPFDVTWEDSPDEADRIARWSAESTRHFLSAPAAVGTVDQALLGALKVKWAHLRAASLSRSLLVVDEVHASDAYMTELLRVLLSAHLEVGGHAMLMSATLGASARTTLIAGHRDQPPDPTTATEVPYPSLTLVQSSDSSTIEIEGSGQHKEVAVKTEPWLASPERIAKCVQAAAEKGAKVLLVRNTVASAQAVFDELLSLGVEDLLLAVNGVVTLHHSRFAVEDRHRLDDAVEAAIGKRRVSGGRIVIGTQTLEQSLDIDADLLVTDLCPVDVLLQRIGRLHRHERKRPSQFAVPRCTVLVPDGGLEAGLDGGLMRHGLGVGTRGGGIYRDLLGIEQTQRLILRFPTWEIPAMNRLLVETATNPIALRDLAQELGGPWEEQEQRTFGFAAAETVCARGHSLTRTCRFDEELTFSDLDEEVRTRLGEDGPRVALRQAVAGPFGSLVQTFNLPAHLFGGAHSVPSRAEIESATLGGTPRDLVLEVGSHRFGYDRAGLRGSGKGTG